MVKLFRALTLLVVAGLTLSGTQAHVHNHCDGFLPENDMKIPVSIFQNGGLTESQFNQVLDKIQAHYQPIFQQLGARLSVNRRWSDGTVNASANQSGGTWVINMYGGLARHPEVTPDGFMLVACHEIGHHIAGAPKISGWFASWASNEGQSDYFTGLKCLRSLLANDAENREFVATNEIEAPLREACERVWNTTEEENRCMRMGMAGRSVSYLFRDLRQESGLPQFDTPDTTVVGQTDDNHPGTQCRLDTYFQSALCTVSVDSPLDNTDPERGTCTPRQGFTVGLRPLCWYKP